MRSYCGVEGRMRAGRCAAGDAHAKAASERAEGSPRRSCFARAPVYAAQREKFPGSVDEERGTAALRSTLRRASIPLRPVFLGGGGGSRQLHARIVARQGDGANGSARLGRVISIMVALASRVVRSCIRRRLSAGGADRETASRTALVRAGGGPVENGCARCRRISDTMSPWMEMRTPQFFTRNHPSRQRRR